MNIYYDFGFYLTVAALVTGVVVLIDKLVWRKARVEKGLEFHEDGQEKMPFFIDLSRSFFPVILIVLVLRSFLYEPYRIPSGSMNPGLYDGDFIVVNKYAYGIRLPIFNTQIIPIGDPQRGDVIVFHPPHPQEKGKNRQDAYIKRLIGLPGDRLEFADGKITIYPKCETASECPTVVIKPTLVDEKAPELVPNSPAFSSYEETIGEKTYPVLFQKSSRSLQQYGTIVLGENEYWGMGDNRDNSSDSRAFGAIDGDSIIGRAAGRWLYMEFSEEPVIFGRHLPTGVSFDRVGSID